MKRVFVFSILLLFGFNFSSYIARCETITQPKLIDKPLLPPLPPALKHASAKGSALIRLKINRSGRVEESHLAHTTGSSALDDFLIKWVTQWRFLPRLENGRAKSGFTMISIRYDLETGLFEAPSPIDIPVEVPPEIIPDTFDKKDSASVENRIEPVTPIKITSIPLSIQKKALNGQCTIYLEIGEGGKVSKVHWCGTEQDKEFMLWIESFLLTIRWKTVSGIWKTNPRYIALPLKYDTRVCKMHFSDAFSVEKLPENILSEVGLHEGKDSLGDEIK